MVLTTGTWTVELQLSEHDGVSHARARLHTGLHEPLTAAGSARLSPEDTTDVAEVGFELAAARALTHLGQSLLATAQLDVDSLDAS